MQNDQSNLLTRSDTFFGVCEGLGEDLGIHPNFFRLGLAGCLFWNPLAAVAAYAALGVLVLLTRLLFPNPRIAASAEQPALAEHAPVVIEEMAEAEQLPIAA
jgi:phage shock protein PspC (stress-responsive transcriptional regulator)